jgi:hypothetical protein
MPCLCPFTPSAVVTLDGFMIATGSKAPAAVVVRATGTRPGHAGRHCTQEVSS